MLLFNQLPQSREMFVHVLKMPGLNFSEKQDTTMGNAHLCPCSPAQLGRNISLLLLLALLLLEQEASREEDP